MSRPEGHADLGHDAPASTADRLAAEPGARPSWPSVLAGLEDDVAYIEQMLARGDYHQALRPDSSWTPPSDLGPIPSDLQQRAMGLLQRQLAAAESLVGQITRSKRQRDVTERMNPKQARPAAAYFDRPL